MGTPRRGGECQAHRCARDRGGGSESSLGRWGHGVGSAARVLPPGGQPCGPGWHVASLGPGRGLPSLRAVPLLSRAATAVPLGSVPRGHRLGQAVADSRDRWVLLPCGPGFGFEFYVLGTGLGLGSRRPPEGVSEGRVSRRGPGGRAGAPGQVERGQASGAPAFPGAPSFSRLCLRPVPWPPGGRSGREPGTVEAQRRRPEPLAASGPGAARGRFHKPGQGGPATGFRGPAGRKSWRLM